MKPIPHDIVQLFDNGLWDTRVGLGCKMCLVNRKTVVRGIAVKTSYSSVIIGWR